MATRKKAALELVEAPPTMREMQAQLAALNEQIEAERAVLKQEAIYEIYLDMRAYGITVIDIAKAQGIKRRRVMNKAKT